MCSLTVTVGWHPLLDALLQRGRLPCHRVVSWFAGNVRLTDFGLSKENVSALDSGAFTFCGTPEYLGKCPCRVRCRLWLTLFMLCSARDSQPRGARPCCRLVVPRRPAVRDANWAGACVLAVIGPDFNLT